MNAAPTTLPAVNGVPLAAAGEALDESKLRECAYRELLRQAACGAGWLDADSVLPEEIDRGIEQLIDREVQVQQPTETECRRYFEAQPARFAAGERVEVRHILLAVTPGVDVNALRRTAESLLVDLRARSAAEPDRFAESARSWSNCPSGASGGSLGWLGAEDCAPEFAREIFSRTEVGVLPRLVHSRFGFHIVEILARAPGQLPSFEAALPAVRRVIESRSFATALRQYLGRLAGSAVVAGVKLEVEDSPQPPYAIDKDQIAPIGGP